MVTQDYNASCCIHMDSVSREIQTWTHQDTENKAANVKLTDERKANIAKNKLI